MRGGNLSNEIAPIIGMRFERVIKTEEGRLNRAAKGFLQHIMGSTDTNVFIITTGDSRKAMSFLMKWGVPYNKVIPAESVLEIPDIARENNFIMYYDLDPGILQNINSRGQGKIGIKQWTQVEPL